MTVAVAGCWELGYSAPLTERDLWLFPLRDFEVDRWLMSPVSGIYEPLLEERDTLEGLEVDGLARVFVDEHGVTELTDFDHPKDALYIFGKAGFSPLRAYGTQGDLSVRVDTPAAGGMMWPHQVAVLTLWHRRAQSWR